MILVQRANLIVSRDFKMVRRTREHVLFPASRHDYPFTRKELKILRCAGRILRKYELVPERASLCFGSDFESSADGEGAAGSDQLRIQEDGDMEIDDMEEFVGELAEEVASEQEAIMVERLDAEEAEFWPDTVADWCARCVRHLAVDPLHICVFEDRKDKCRRCVEQGRGGGLACVETPCKNDEQVRRLLYRAHQARYYNTDVAKVRVISMAKKVGVVMKRKPIRGNRVAAPTGHVVVQVPGVRSRTPSPVGPADHSETPPSTMRTIIGRFKDVFRLG